MRKRYVGWVLLAALLLTGCGGYELPARTETTAAQTESAAQNPTQEIETEAPATAAPETDPGTEPPTEAETEAVTEAAAEPSAQPEETVGETQGEAQPETQEETEAPAPTEASREYVLNTNTKKFHKPSCGSVKRIKEKNREDYYGSRSELLARGYEPCGKCHP